MSLFIANRLPDLDHDKSGHSPTHTSRDGIQLDSGFVVHR